MIEEDIMDDHIILEYVSDDDMDFLEGFSCIPAADDNDDQNEQLKVQTRRKRPKEIKRKSLNKFVTDKKLVKLRTTGIHTPKISVYSVDTDLKKRKDRRRKCMICKSRVNTSCKECNSALCFEVSDDVNGNPSCWEVFHKYT